jgi:hypothetical protein
MARTSPTVAAARATTLARMVLQQAARETADLRATAAGGFVRPTGMRDPGLAAAAAHYTARLDLPPSATHPFAFLACVKTQTFARIDAADAAAPYALNVGGAEDSYGTHPLTLHEVLLGAAEEVPYAGADAGGGQELLSAVVPAYFGDVLGATPQGGTPQSGTRFEAVYASDVPLRRAEPNDEAGHLVQSLCDLSCLGGLGEAVAGVNTSFMYAGTRGSTFGLHVEDQALASANLLVSGAPKVWFLTRPCDYAAVSEEAQKYGTCVNVASHKRLVLTPDFLQRLIDKGVSVTVLVQRPGDLVVTHPLAFHGGFNCGPNLAEAINLATPSWAAAAPHYRVCRCVARKERFVLPQTAVARMCQSACPA